jgi:hypothetical protein
VLEKYKNNFAKNSIVPNEHLILLTINKTQLDSNLYYNTHFCLAGLGLEYGTYSIASATGAGLLVVSACSVTNMNFSCLHPHVSIYNTGRRWLCIRQIGIPNTQWEIINQDPKQVTLIMHRLMQQLLTSEH